jgi:hypothetical protein
VQVLQYNNYSCNICEGIVLSQSPTTVTNLLKYCASTAMQQPQQSHLLQFFVNTAVQTHYHHMLKYCVSTTTTTTTTTTVAKSAEYCASSVVQ